MTLYTNNITTIYHLHIIVIDKVTTSMDPSSNVQLGQVSDTSLSVVPHYTVPRVFTTSDHHSVVAIILNEAGTTEITMIITSKKDTKYFFSKPLEMVSVGLNINSSCPSPHILGTDTTCLLNVSLDLRGGLEYLNTRLPVLKDVMVLASIIWYLVYCLQV